MLMGRKSMQYWIIINIYYLSVEPLLFDSVRDDTHTHTHSI